MSNYSRPDDYAVDNSIVIEVKTIETTVLGIMLLTIVLLSLTSELLRLPCYSCPFILLLEIRVVKGYSIHIFSALVLTPSLLLKMDYLLCLHFPTLIIEHSFCHSY